jgi:fatty acid desaturase
MAGSLIFSAVIFLLLIISVRERIRLRSLREKDWSFIGEGKASPLSEALTNLIGVAGGIYLTLVVLTAFLELQLPELINLGRISLEPLAAVSIFLALIQPYLQRVLNAWRRL